MEPQNYTRDNLQQLSVRQLRDICRDRQLSGYSKYVKQGKAALIEFVSYRLCTDARELGTWIETETVVATAMELTPEAPDTPPEGGEAGGELLPTNTCQFDCLAATRIALEFAVSQWAEFKRWLIQQRQIRWLLGWQI